MRAQLEEIEDGHSSNRRGAGWPHKVPRNLGSWLEQIVGKGLPDGQRFNSIDAAINACPTLKQEIKQLGACQRTIKTAIVAADPSPVQR
jgi:hypothetical protein